MKYLIYAFKLEWKVINTTFEPEDNSNTLICVEESLISTFRNREYTKLLEALQTIQKYTAYFSTFTQKDLEDWARTAVNYYIARNLPEIIKNEREDL